MNRLLAIVSGVFPIRAKELAVSCIGSVAMAVEVSAGGQCLVFYTTGFRNLYSPS
jgi:hypothetical protein